LLDVGQAAPGFSLEEITGKRWTLGENLENSEILAVFFKISCPTCQLTLPFLERLRSKVEVVGISQDDSASTAEFLDYFRITFPVLTDPASYSVSRAYGLTNVPSMFLIEKNGLISWALNGFHRADLEGLATRFGTTLFRDSDKVPAMKPG
jgi:peroxiredoxin